MKTFLTFLLLRPCFAAMRGPPPPGAEERPTSKGEDPPSPTSQLCGPGGAAWSDHDFHCPITHDFFEFPVLARDGHVYDKRAIEAHFAASLGTSEASLLANPGRQIRSPLTNLPLLGGGAATAEEATELLNVGLDDPYDPRGWNLARKRPCSAQAWGAELWRRANMKAAGTGPAGAAEQAERVRKLAAWAALRKSGASHVYGGFDVYKTPLRALCLGNLRKLGRPLVGGSMERRTDSWRDTNLLPSAKWAAGLRNFGATLGAELLRGFNAARAHSDHARSLAADGESTRVPLAARHEAATQIAETIRRESLDGWSQTESLLAAEMADEYDRENPMRPCLRLLQRRATQQQPGGPPAIGPSGAADTDPAYQGCVLSRLALARAGDSQSTGLAVSVARWLLAESAFDTPLALQRARALVARRRGGLAGSPGQPI